MRTTIRIDEALLARVKEIAARTGKTITVVIEDALRESIGRRDLAAHAERRIRPLPTFGKGGTMPGVDLDDGASLLDLMENSDDSA